MADKILSVRLQEDILSALSVFYPESMTTKQYLSCFDDIDEFVMIMNISELIRRGLVHQKAIRYCDGEPFLCLGYLKLEPKRSEMAIKKNLTT
jgi:hypothetical protein